MVLEMMSGHNPHDIRKGLAKAEVSKKVKTSLIGVLDDVCKQDKNDGTTYCERAAKQWNGKKDANGPLFEGPKFGAEEFTVIHFAGPVKYGTTEVDKVKFLPPSMWEKNGIDLKCPQIESFVTKNKDKVPQSLLDFFAEKASNDYYQYITAPVTPNGICFCPPSGLISTPPCASRAARARSPTPPRPGRPPRQSSPSSTSRSR